VTLLTPGERLGKLDERAESLKTVLLEAAEELDRSSEVPDEVTRRLDDELRRMADVRSDVRPDDFDRDQLATAFQAMLDMRDLVDRREHRMDLDTLDGLLVAVERFRHVIRDAIDENVPGLAQATAVVVQQLEEWLEGTPKTRLAELLGITVRTLHRWESRPDPPNHRLATVAKLVSVLRHAWTPDGILAWFQRPKPELGNRRPVDLLEQPEEAAALVAAAQSMRSMYAT
jgi:putative toxin-antitoxin system antitoxin component (TIGR02293 family)